MPGLIRGIARTAVVAGTASAVGGRVRHRQDQKWAAQGAPQAQPAYQAPPAYAQPVPEQRSVPAPPDKLQQLKDLGELKAQGVLTQQEFDAEKAKILAS
jgi:hypothetical protein